MPRKVIRDGKLVNVVTREVLPWEVVIDGLVITFIGPDASGFITSTTEVIDAKGMYLVPGLVSGHDHTEMAGLSVVPFAEAVIPAGTTAVMLDPHDTVNVLGIDGLRMAIEESRLTSLKTYFMVPPCVPPAPRLETAGCRITLSDVQRGMGLPGVFGLAEAMDFNGIIRGNPVLTEIFDWAREKHLMVDGHCPELRGADLARYIAAGIRTDHESISVEEQIEKLRLGMYVILRRGSIQEPMSAGELVRQLTDTSGLMLAVDGCISVEDILEHGHMSWAVRQIIAEEVDPLVAIQMATINVARCYGLDQRIGMISPGRSADILFVGDLTKFDVSAVILDGEIVKGRPTFPRYQFPRHALSSIHMKEVSTEDLAITATGKSARVRVIKINEGSLLTDEIHEDFVVQDGKVVSDLSRDLLKVVVFERYGGETRSIGFIKGFCLTSGAFAGSIGQDSQNIVAVGVSDSDIVVAVNRVREMQGGVVAVDQGQIVAELELPIAGIMTDIDPQHVIRKRAKIFRALKNMGCGLSDPIFSLSLCITLGVIPALKMSNKGLVNVQRGEIVSLFV